MPKITLNRHPALQNAVDLILQIVETQGSKPFYITDAKLLMALGPAVTRATLEQQTYEAEKARRRKLKAA